MTSKTKIIERIKAVASGFVPQAEVFLFGSRARGTSKAASDWDVLVLLNVPTISFDTETQFMDQFYEVELETGAVISPLIYTKEQWNRQRTTPLFKNIEKEGIKLQ
jgi:uncharacterized protein